MAMNEDLGILIVEMDANFSHLEGIAAGLSREQFNWRPEPGHWSIGQCVSHLNIVDGGDIEPLRAAIESGRARGLTGEGPFRYGFLSRKIIASMDLPVKKKSKAPEIYNPPDESERESAISEYRRVYAELRKLAVSANGLDLARVKTDLPALPAPLRPFLKMALGARLTLITTHDRRHLWQAEQVRNHGKFPM
jgi:DinB superfamily